MRGILCQFGSAFQRRTQITTRLNDLGKSSRMLWTSTPGFLPFPWPFPHGGRCWLWLQPSSQVKAWATREMWRHFYQENKPFSIIPETFCSLWLKLCHMVTSSCKGRLDNVYLAVPNVHVIFTTEKEENILHSQLVASATDTISKEIDWSFRGLKVEVGTYYHIKKHT